MTADTKVMPVATASEDFLNLYSTSSKLVTLKRSVTVNIPAMAGKEESQIAISINRYDTFDSIMQRISEEVGVAESEVAWQLVWPDTGEAIRLRELGWLKEGSTITLLVPSESGTEQNTDSTRTVTVFRNGDVTRGVNYGITRHDNCESIIQFAGHSLGIDEAHMADDPALFDEAGLQLSDNDLGWLKNGARLFIVAQHRYYQWPNYEPGTKIRIQHPESPLPGKHIELTTLSNVPNLLKIDNFLSDDEVNHLIEVASQRLEDSVTGANADGTHAHRTSKNAWESNTPISRRLIYRAFSLARVPFADNQRDAIQILHYGPSDRYIVHTDWFSAGGYEGWNTSIIGNTNRYATVFFYLNDVEFGGHTVFPKAKNSPQQDMIYNMTQEMWDKLPGEAKIMKQCKPGSPGIHVPAKKGTV
jgi:hypothetical protein